MKEIDKFIFKRLDCQPLICNAILRYKNDLYIRLNVFYHFVERTNHVENEEGY